MLKAGPVRILRIIARLNIGGPAIQAISLSDELSSDAYESLLVCGEVGSHEGDMGYLAEKKGIQPVILKGMGREISPLRDTVSFVHLRKIIKQFRPHIIHTHTAKAGTVGRLAAMSINGARRSDRRIRLVHTFHGHVFHGYFGPLKTGLFIQIERFLSRFTDRIIVVSPRQQRDICFKFKVAAPERVRIIPLGFDLSAYRDRGNHRKRIREKYVSPGSQEMFLVGIVGRLTKIKNHHLLLRAVRCLKDMGKVGVFKFLVVGDGELREDLIRYARRLGVHRSVVFAGWQRDMPAIYSALDMVALTSRNEGTPVTLIEAMSSGKPVVATDVGGVRDLMGAIEDEGTDGYKLAENGILVSPGEEEIFARALLFLSGNRGVSARMAEHAREFALNRYSKERLVKEIKLLYEELVKS